jgi:hypothetical protein
MQIPTTLTAAALVVTLWAPAAAQTPAPADARRTQPGSATPIPPVTSDLDARTTREQLRELMQRFPPDLARVLKMDPTLMRSDSYLAQYPALAQFLAQHPDVAHNPQFYFSFVQLEGGDWPQPADSRTESVRMVRSMMEWLGALGFFITGATLSAWFIKTFIDYRRWLRVSKVQTEVHNKLMERFSGTGDLLAYVQSPAGRRFLESAPIPLDPGTRTLGAPLSRILWSVQAGVVFTIVGAGFEVVSRRVIEDVGEPMSVFAVLAIALGIGFIASGAVSYILSRRLGLLDPPPLVPIERLPGRHDSSSV